MSASRRQEPPHVANGYPQLVLRLMPAVYTRSAVAFTTDPLRLGSDHGDRFFRVLDPHPDAGETLTPERRQAVVDAAQRLADDTNLRVSAAFSPADAVYVSPGSAPRASAQPPEGGLNLYGVQHLRSPPA